MKKLLLIVVVVVMAMLCANAAMAVDWIGTNQATVAWNEVTQNESGGAFPAGDTITYRVYTKSLPNGPDTPVGDTAQLQYTLTFSQEGRYVVGVQTVRVPEGQTEELVSTIVWSDSTDTAAVPNPFGIVYYERPSSISGLSPSAQ